MDIDSLLEGLGNAPSTDGLDDFLATIPSSDAAAIFVPVDSSVENDWIGSGGGGQLPPLQQWVKRTSSHKYHIIFGGLT